MIQIILLKLNILNFIINNKVNLYIYIYIGFFLKKKLKIKQIPQEGKKMDYFNKLKQNYFQSTF